jgi:acetyl-CoA carboxylase carboxyl transferase subunit alpha
MVSFLDFEKPVAALDARIAELRETAQSGELDIDNEIAKLQQRSAKMLADTYAKLTPWQKTQVARHPERPHFKHYVAGIFDEFLPLAGDRAFGDDQAILGGFAKLGKRRVMVIGHEKGDDTASRLRHNFGMGKPEGYRKAIRLMQLADRFGLPVVTLVDTSGAFPACRPRSAGRRKPSRARPSNALPLACRWSRRSWAKAAPAARSRLAAANRVLMLEHAVY